MGARALITHLDRVSVLVPPALEHVEDLLQKLVARLGPGAHGQVCEPWVLAVLVVFRPVNRVFDVQHDLARPRLGRLPFLLGRRG